MNERNGSIPIKNRACRLWRREDGVSTIEWIGLAATILVLLGAVAAYIIASNGGPVGPAVAGEIQQLILSLGPGGSGQPGNFPVGDTEPQPPSPEAPTLGVAQLVTHLADPSISAEPNILDDLRRFFGDEEEQDCESKHSGASLIGRMKKQGGKAKELAELLEAGEVEIIWISGDEMAQYPGASATRTRGMYVSSGNQVFLNSSALCSGDVQVILAVLAHEATHAKQAREANEIPDEATIERNRAQTIAEFVKTRENSIDTTEMSPEELEELRSSVLGMLYGEMEQEHESFANGAEVYRNGLGGLKRQLYDWGLNLSDNYPLTMEQIYDRYRSYYQNALSHQGLDIKLPATYAEFLRTLPPGVAGLPWGRG